MPEISLPRQVTGRELTDIIKSVAKKIDFEYYNFDKDISVGRQFREYVPEHLKFAFDVTPSLEFNFGKIYSKRNYTSLPCQTMIGTMSMRPTNFEGDEVKYKSHYDRFVEEVTQHLQ